MKTFFLWHVIIINENKQGMFYMKEENKKKGSKKKHFRRLFFASLFLSFVTLMVLYFLNVLPIFYFVCFAIGFVTFDFFMALLMLGKGWKKRLFGTILTSFKMLLLIFVLLYSFNTFDFLNKINKGNCNTENYSIIVLNSSSYEKLKDIKDKKIGIVKILEDKGLLEAKLHLNKKTALEYKEMEDIGSLASNLLNSSVDAILIEEAEKILLEEENPEFVKKEKVIYEFSIEVELNDELVKNVDITKDAFNIFISGIDSYGKITSVSRSDVNMVVSVNPTTHEILLTSIPRDYYVKLHGISTTLRDKLTHAGIHGIDTSVKTVEDLLEIDINYYAKVNFTSLVHIVDKLGGIDVNVTKPFRAFYIEEDETIDYYFQKGINHLNGKQALAFARERKSLASGDVGRAEHQQILIEALLNKALSKAIITKYNDLLNALEGKFVTNFGTENITKLVKQQLKNMPTWKIEKNTLKGTDSHQFTYSYKSLKSYVMEPDMESVREAKEKIKKVIEKN